MKKEYLSMAEASKICPYEKGYLSLLARRGELRAEKNGRNWYTKIAWLNEYLAKKKPNAVISESESIGDDVLNKKEKKFFRATWIWLALTTAIVVVGFVVYGKISNQISVMQKQTNQFVPSEIVKVPDDQGNYDVYSTGTIKVGKEKGPLSP